MEALPLVGHGQAYRRAGIPVLGHTRQGSTGGLGYTSLGGQLTDLLEGQPLYLLQQLALLRRRSSQYGLVVGVGDLLAVLAAWLSRRPSAIYLVAYSSHYEGRLRLPWPCTWLLRQPAIQAIWSRDALTASDLSQQLGARCASSATRSWMACRPRPRVAPWTPAGAAAAGQPAAGGGPQPHPDAGGAGRPAAPAAEGRIGALAGGPGARAQGGDPAGPGPAGQLAVAGSDAAGLRRTGGGAGLGHLCAVAGPGRSGGGRRRHRHRTGGGPGQAGGAGGGPWAPVHGPLR